MTALCAFRLVLRRARSDCGQTMAEYAVILAVIAIAVIVAITALSGGIGDAIDNVTDILPGGSSTTP